MDGEREFAAFYQRTARPLWAYIYRASGQAADADEIVQDAYLRLLQTRVVLDEPAARRYLFRIASNLLVDRWRSAQRRRSWLERWRAEPAWVEPEGPRALEQADAARAMADTFKRLTPRERALLWLAHVERLGHTDIAEALGLRAASVKVLLFRARRRLRDVLNASQREERYDGVDAGA